MNQQLIAFFIATLTLEDARKYATQYGIKASDQELANVLQFLKNNRYRLSIQNKNTLLNEARPLMNESTYQSVKKLLDNLLK